MEILNESLVLHKRTVLGKRRLAERLHDFCPTVILLGRRSLAGRTDHCVKQLLQMAKGDVFVGVPRRNNFALFCQPYLAANRFLRLRENRAVGRATAAANAAHLSGLLRGSGYPAG